MGHFKAVCCKTTAAAGSTSRSVLLRRETRRTSTIFSYQTAQQPSAYMEWVKGEFKEQPPSQPQQVAVTVSVIHVTHWKFGKRSTKPTQLDAFAHMAQTCTSGLDILNKLKIPKSTLISTWHKICGVTHTYLVVVGAAFVSNQLNGKASWQVLYITNNASGLYLSECALKDLQQVIHYDFPNVDVSHQNASSMDNHADKVITPCDWDLLPANWG